MSDEPAQRSALEATVKTAFAPTFCAAVIRADKSDKPAQRSALSSHRAPHRSAYGRSYRLHSAPHATDSKSHAQAFGLTDGAAISTAFCATQWTAFSAAITAAFRAT